MEEKNLQGNNAIEEQGEIGEVEKKTLPLGVIIGIAAGAVALVVAIVLIIVFAGGNRNNVCDGHVDADDDYLCDKCGDHFDDGDETVIPEVVGVDVTFTVKLDSGESLSGVRFRIYRNEKEFNLVSGADGSVKGNIPAGTYYIEFDSTTFPSEYCYVDMYGVKIEETTTAVSILVVNNEPDGSVAKPFPINDETLEISIAPGEELYYSSRGTGFRYVEINGGDLVVSYNGQTYTSEDGKLIVGITSEDVETPAIFSVKNNTGDVIVAELDVYAPLGSYDNPRELNETDASIDVADGKTEYYAFRAEKNGIFVITTSTLGGEILVTRNIIRINDDGEETVISTITSECSYGYAGYIYVSEGDEIKIGDSYVAPGDNVNTVADDNSTSHTVDFTHKLYSATEEDPAPVLNSGVFIRLDGGESIVFSAAAGSVVQIASDNSVDVYYDGVEITNGAEFVVEADSVFTVSNKTDALSMFTIIVK